MTKKKCIIILSAIGGGLFLNFLNVPAGAMVGSILGTAAAQFLTNIKIKISTPIKQSVRIIMGCYIGLGITAEGLLQIKNIAGAAAIMIFGMMAITLILIYILVKFCKFGMKEAFLSSLPAGLSEISMNADDFKVDPLALTTIHLMRLITILTFVPIILKLLYK